jgi:DNA-3-methyladenine glycosylase II
MGYEAVGEVDSRLETFADWKQPNEEGVIHYLQNDRVRGVAVECVGAGVGRPTTDRRARSVYAPGPQRAAAGEDFKPGTETMRLDSFLLEPILPFRLDLTVWALRPRADKVVDRWHGQTYRRVLPLLSGPAALRCEVKQVVTAALKRLLGFRTDVAVFYPFAPRNAALGPLVQRLRGMKPPRFATIFESGLTAIASQLVTRTVGVLLLNRLTVSYCAAVRKGHAAAYAFPQAGDLATLHPADLRQLGFSRQKGRAMIELANLIALGGLDLEGLAELSDQEAIERFCSLRGLGRWSAEYVLLRGLGRTHVFPSDDVGTRKNLQRWLNLVKPLDYAACTALWSAGARTPDWFTFTCCGIDWRVQDSR